MTPLAEPAYALRFSAEACSFSTMFGRHELKRSSAFSSPATAALASPVRFRLAGSDATPPPDGQKLRPGS